jgi:hypothetical protein
MDSANEDKNKILTFDVSEENVNPPSLGRIVTNRAIYEKYDSNLNNRLDYVFKVPSAACTIALFYILMFFIVMILCIFLCSPDFSGGTIKYGAVVTIFIIIFIVGFCLLTLLPLSKQYKLSFSNKQFTYQNMSFIPNIFLKKKNIINIEDALYFRENIVLVKSSYLVVPSYNVGIVKMNKNYEEVEIVNFGKLIINGQDGPTLLLYRIQKVARLLNEIIGFDINLVKKIKKAYINKDDVALQNIIDGMEQNKKALFQNLFNKMGIDIKFI